MPILYSRRMQALLQVAEGLEYLHTSDPPIVHGDLRGDNILISHTGAACIGDFGLSQKLAESEGENSTSWHNAGNIRYMAPELLTAATFKEGQRTTQIDIFAFGRVMYQLLAMERPFVEMPTYSVTVMVLNNKIPLRPEDEGAKARGLNDGMWDLMTKCWVRYPAQRSNAPEAVLHIRKVEEWRALPLHRQVISSCILALYSLFDWFMKFFFASNVRAA